MGLNSPPRLPKVKEERKFKQCAVTMESKAIENHIHKCAGEHEHGEDHFCTSCMRWWGKKGEKR
jgi:hypothetical protein